MNNGPDNDLATDRTPEDGVDGIATLIGRAGRRQPVPTERYERTRRQVHAHWQHVVREQAPRHQTRWWPAAAAASVVLALGAVLTWQLLPPTGAPVPLAVVERVQGTVYVGDSLVQPGVALASQAALRTSDGGRVALRLAGGQSMRLDEGTQLVLAAANRVSLAAGAVYFDVPPNAAAPVAVETPLGTARDVGTQFQVRLEGDAVIIGVREGLVEIGRADDDTLAVRAGEFIQLSEAEAPERRAIDADDPRWQWAESIAPEFRLEGATLEAFLEWYARERGLTLAFADDDHRQRAQQAILSGSIAGLSLDAALDAVSRTNRFAYTVEKGVLSVVLQ